MDQFNIVFNLLDQMIEKKQFDDIKEKNLSGGESWDLHHLKLLKTILIDIKNGQN